MRLDRFVRALYKWWWLIVVSVVAASATSYMGTRALPRTYVSQTTLMVGQALQNPNPSQSELYAGWALAQSYADLARREPVLRATLEALGLGWNYTDLQGMVLSRAIPGTQLMEISVTDTDPQRARALADEIAHQLISQSPTNTDPQKEAEHQFVLDQMQELKANIEKSQEEIRALDEVIAKSTGARQIQEAHSQQATLQTQIASWQATYAQLGEVLQHGSPNSLSVVEPARIPKEPVGPRVGFNVLMAAVIGLALASSAALLLEFTDDSLKTSDDIRRVLHLETVGSIPRIDGDDYPSQLVMLKQPRSPAAEAFRTLRTNLQLGVHGHPVRTLMITSPGPKEGKSLMAANLATTIAQFGARVILVDADLRRPTQHSIFELNNQAGLSMVLTDTDASLDGILQRTSIGNLRVLTSGPLPNDPAELLGSKRMTELLKLLQQSADVIIFDCPPVLAAADARALAPHVESALLVMDRGHTRQAMAQQCMEALEAAKANVSGVIINRLPLRENEYSYYYYAEDVQRRRRRTIVKPRTPAPSLPTAPRTLPQPRSAVTSVDQAASIVRPAAPRLGQAAPHKGIVTPAVTQAVPKATGTYQKVSAPASAAGTLRDQRRAPRTARMVGKIRQMAPSSLGLAILGVSTAVVLIAVLASSLTMQQSPGTNNAPTPAIAAAETTVVSTPAPTAILVHQAVVTITKAPDVSESPTEPPRADTKTIATTGTAIAGATATQAAINAAAAQQALGLLNCETMDFEILESPPDTTQVTANAVDTEFTWRVRNKASLSYCKWGQEKQETRLIQAVETGRQVDASIPVTLRWVGNDEYYLSIKTRLGVGKYDLRWKLLLPKMTVPGGLTLRARAVVLAPTPTPRPTLIPTPAVCREVVYQCNCRQECSGRTCTKECEECTRQECK